MSKSQCTALTHSPPSAVQVYGGLSAKCLLKVEGYQAAPAFYSPILELQATIYFSSEC